MILFAGDPHGSYEHLYPILQQQTEEVALVILGDLQLTTPDELDRFRSIVIFGLFMVTMTVKPLLPLILFGIVAGKNAIFTVK